MNRQADKACLVLPIAEVAVDGAQHLVHALKWGGLGGGAFTPSGCETLPTIPIDKLSRGLQSIVEAINGDNRLPNGLVLLERSELNLL